MTTRILFNLNQHIRAAITNGEAARRCLDRGLYGSSAVHVLKRDWNAGEAERLAALIVLLNLKRGD